MRPHVPLLLTSLLMLLDGGCAPRMPEPEYRLKATIKDIMESVVDPNADFLWNSVSIEATAAGVTTNMPRTDQDWANLRHSAITMMEATNLLQMPGRLVAQPGEKAENPGIEESPEAIKELMDKDRASWIKYAHGLYDATALMIKAIDAKNVDGVSDAGEVLDKACESCHTHYWYPHQFDYQKPKAAPSMAPSSVGKKSRE